MMRQAIKALLRLEKNIDNQLNFERFIRTYAPLDAEEERRYNKIYAKEVAHMMSVREEVISSVREELERKGEARGRLIGREEGREEGRGTASAIPWPGCWPGASGLWMPKPRSALPQVRRNRWITGRMPC